MKLYELSICPDEITEEDPQDLPETEWEYTVAFDGWIHEGERATRNYPGSPSWGEVDWDTVKPVEPEELTEEQAFVLLENRAERASEVIIESTPTDPADIWSGHPDV